MRHLDDHALIDRDTLRHARHLAGSVSRGELAGRACARLGAPERAGTIYRALARIERGHGVRLEHAAIEALAAELGLWRGVDLTLPLRWVYRAPDPRDPIKWVQDRLPVFSTALAAHAARRRIDALRRARPAEIFYTELMVELGDDESLMLLDPS